MIYRALPFIYEIQILLDWTITYTSLNLFEWFNINEVYSFLYIAKVNSINFLTEKIGTPVSKILKFGLGVIGLIIIFGLIYGPLFLFSDLNPISSKNPIKNV